MIEQNYTLNCDCCGEPFTSKDAFPSPPLCPSCEGLLLTDYELVINCQKCSRVIARDEFIGEGGLCLECTQNVHIIKGTGHPEERIPFIDGLLLTPEEIYIIIREHNEARMKPSRTELALIEAQLAKAKQYYEGVIRQEQVNLDATVTTYEQKIREIEKQEKERIIKWLEDNCYIMADTGNRIITPKKWQALKGEK